MQAEARWTTRANLLTAVRALAAPLLVCAVLADEPVLATLLFAVAVLTDFADGWVARRYGEASPLGGAIDHTVDATFVTAGTAALAWAGALPAALPPLIALAFVQYVVDSRAGGGAGLRASALGRWNGIAYYGAVAVPIVRDALGLGWPGAALVHGLAWGLVASTVLSMADRALAWRRARAARPSDPEWTDPESRPGG